MAEVLDEVERDREDGATFTGGGFNAGFAVLLVFIMLWLGVGVLILWREPRHWAGWLFLITGLGFPLITLTQAVVGYGIKADPGSIPFDRLLGVRGRVRALSRRDDPAALPALSGRASAQPAMALGRDRPRRRHGARDPRVPLPPGAVQQLDRAGDPLREPVRRRRARRCGPDADRRGRRGRPDLGVLHRVRRSTAVQAIHGRGSSTDAMDRVRRVRGRRVLRPPMDHRVHLRGARARRRGRLRVPLRGDRADVGRGDPRRLPDRDLPLRPVEPRRRRQEDRAVRDRRRGVHRGRGWCSSPCRSCSWAWTPSSSRRS